MPFINSAVKVTCLLLPSLANGLTVKKINMRTQFNYFGIACFILSLFANLWTNNGEARTSAYKSQEMTSNIFSSSIIAPSVSDNEQVLDGTLQQVVISGNVFLDENYNRIRDNGESGIANANVIIRGPLGFTYYGLTDVNGYFSVTGPEGFYDEIGVAPQDGGPFCWNGFGYYIGLGYAFEVLGNVNLNFAFFPGEDLDNDLRCDYRDCKDNNPDILAPGDLCDDGDFLTTNDLWTEDCKCEGVPLYCEATTQQPSTIKLKNVYVNGVKAKKNKPVVLSSGAVNMSYYGTYPRADFGPISGAVYVDNNGDGSFDQTVLTFFEPSPDPLGPNAGEVFVSGSFNIPLTGEGLMRVVLKKGIQTAEPCGDQGDADIIDVLFAPEVNAAASASSPHTGIAEYFPKERSNFGGRSYYRLKSINEKGRFIYSYFQPLPPSHNDGLLKVYPNPAKDEINIQIREYQGLDGYLRIINAQGWLVHEQFVEKLPTDLVTIKTSNFPAGVYFVNWYVDGKKPVSQKLLILNSSK